MVRKTFSPADAGTPEVDWRSMLHDAAEWQPANGPLLVVAPHPDDEVLGAGGLVWSWAATGRQVCVLSVTDGEAADPGRADLCRIRRAELRNALRTLSASHIEVHRLAIPDGRVGEHLNLLRRALVSFVPDRPTLIAPYEDDGHPDHEHVGRVCREVARTHGLSIARYPVWTWHHTEPASVRALEWRLFKLDSAAQRAKARALQCFESQLRPPQGAPIVPPHVLTHFERPYEAFVL